MRRLGAIWQQITGAAIAGPLKGAKLSLVAQDELTVWAVEERTAERHRPGASAARCCALEKATWESEIGEAADRDSRNQGDASRPRDDPGCVDERSRARVPLSKLTIASPVLIDDVGGKPVMLVLGPDGKSVRAFSREIGSNTLEFYGRGGEKRGDPWVLLDSDSLSDWSFEGCAFSGPMKGKCLTADRCIKRLLVRLAALPSG